MSRKRKTTPVVDKLDRGTPETRRRISVDTLTSSTLDPHRQAAGRHIREALEDGLGARGLDIVRIGMGGGASSGGGGGWTPDEALMVSRHCLGKWRLLCHAQEIRSDVVEAFVGGNSCRQIAAAMHIRRSRVSDIVDAGLDLYADMRDLRRSPVRGSRISVWEAPATPVSASADRDIRALPVAAALRNRNIRSDRETKHHAKL